MAAGSSTGGVRALFRLQRTIVVLLFVSFVCGMVLGICLVTNADFGTGVLGLIRSENQGPPGHARGRTELPVLLQEIAIIPVLREHAANKSLNSSISTIKPLKLSIHKPRKHHIIESEEVHGDEAILQGRKYPKPNYNVHIFYYPWYGTPKIDGKWLHWNHRYLPHWDKREATQWPSGQHKPPDDIGSNFYPELGPYSSRDIFVIESHMRQIRSTGIGVLAVSWYPPKMADDNGEEWDEWMPTLLDKAHNYSLKICLHIEPFKNRNHLSWRKYLQYIVDRYGKHPALYRYTYHGRDLPLYYIYDSYLTPYEDWAKLFRPDGTLTVRNTPLDGIFIGLLVEEPHKTSLVKSGFDGFYTYFASDGFTYGSSTRSWPLLSSFAHTHNALFIPSIGPGYVDKRIRPWNDRNTKDREQGGYYEQSFKSALLAKPNIVTITSFNEWHEGTQIERAVPKKTPAFQYEDYSPNNPDYYLMLTRKWVHKFRRHQTN